jgi:membrane-associated phospholipid phosphatase
VIWRYWAWPEPLTIWTMRLMSLLSWGTNAILILQSRSYPVLDWILIGVTFLGTEEFYMLLLPVLVWCLDKKAGLRIALLVLLSTYLNQTAKAICQSPRPDPEVVRWMTSADGWGFPSGHAQTTTALFGYLASWMRPVSWASLLWAVPLLVSFSRVYLGVHYPHDVVGGALAGLALLYLFRWSVHGRPARWWEQLGAGTQCVVLGFTTIGLAAPGASAHAVTAMGSLLGMGCGAIWDRHTMHFSPRATLKRQLRKLGVGVSLLLLVYVAGKVLLPDTMALRFARYAVLGLVATGSVPWLFVRWGWGQTTAERTDAPCATR